MALHRHCRAAGLLLGWGRHDPPSCPAEVWLTWTLQYSNAVPGGLLDLDSWVETFPQIDTVHKKGAAEAEAARIQGKSGPKDERQARLAN